LLNDMNGFHVKAEHVLAALGGCCGRVFGEGNVAGGTGMICYEFKGAPGILTPAAAEIRAVGRSPLLCRRTSDAVTN